MSRHNRPAVMDRIDNRLRRDRLNVTPNASSRTPMDSLNENACSSQTRAGSRNADWFRSLVTKLSREHSELSNTRFKRSVDEDVKDLQICKILST
ncbi:MAG: hypothetical protein MHMPM18_003612 [Marteilia pararefringens]